MRGIFLEGNQRAVILFHAYTGSTADVRMLGTYLNQKGYSVYMPLLSGHGTDDIRHVLAHTIDRWQLEANEAVQFLVEKGYTQIAVFGLSMGGMLATSVLCERFKSVVGGGLFNSPIPLIDFTAVRQMFFTYANRLYKPGMGDKAMYDTFIQERTLEQMQNIQRFTEYIVEKLNHISVPFYIAQSGKDELIPSDSGEKLMQRLHFTSVDYRFFPEATHVITVGAYRNVFFETVYDFIETLEWKI